MSATLRKLLTLALASTFLIALPHDPAIAAVGDTDSYFNLESNTTSNHNYAMTTNDAAVHFTSAFSFEMWLRPTNVCTSVYCHFLVKENEYAFAVVNGTYQFALNGAGGGWAWQNSTIKAQINSWQHFAITHVALTNEVNMYINGQLVYTGPAEHLTTQNFYNSASSFQIGARVSTTNVLTNTGVQSFIGSIDEVKLWQVVRSQSQIQSDMNSYGPVNNSDLTAYYDFNDVSGSTISNKASGGGATLTIENSPQVLPIETSTVIGGTKVVKFPRTYLSANGWKPPIGVTSLNALVVGGGGGGGNNVGNGGGGGGGYQINNFPVKSNSAIGIKVGTGGAGGRKIAAGTVVYDGTTLMDGQNGDSSIANIDGTSFTGGGGGGGNTIWTNNLCGGDASGALSLAGTAGTGSGVGGTSFTGGLGGALSATQSVANGASGWTPTFTGAGTYYGSGGGTGSWSSYVSGVGGNASQGGDGNGGEGVNLTGSGGGGNVAGCAEGGKGGSGIVIFTFSAFTGGASAVINPSFRNEINISVTVTSSGKVSFYAFGKIIPKCRNVSTVSSTTITATCAWSPSQRGAIPLKAIFTPTASPSNPATINFDSVFVTKRVGTR